MSAVTIPQPAPAPPVVAQPSPSEAIKLLWDMPIKVIVISGPLGSGKTLGGLTIAPRETCDWDFEDSAAIYEKSMQLKRRVSMGTEMLRRHPQGHRPIELYDYWLADMRAIKPNQFRVLMIDPISEIENGIADWVRANPKHFGVTALQYEKMAGLFWQHVKNLWKAHIMEMSAKCETVVLVSHMKNEWEGKSTTGRKIPKGLDTLEEMASLFVILDRSPNKQTAVIPDKPRAIVKKSRLASMHYDHETGNIEPKPILPPRLDVFTPAEIRRYIAKDGLDYSKLAKKEQIDVEVLSEDEKLQMRAEIAVREAESAQARLALEEVQIRAAQSHRENAQFAAAQDLKNRTAAEHGGSVPLKDVLPTMPEDAPAPAVQSAPNPPVQAAPTQTAPSSPVTGERPTDAQMAEIKRLKEALAPIYPTERYKASLASRGVQSALQLTPAQADEFIGKLKKLEDDAAKSVSKS